MRSGRINFAKRTDYFGPGAIDFFVFISPLSRHRCLKIRAARSFNVRRCLANLPSYYNDDDANELPVVLPVGRIVRGWNIIRAYGRPPSFSLLLSLSFSLSLMHSYTLSKRFTCLARNSLPPRFFLSRSFFFFFASSFFHQCLRSFLAVHGEHRSRSLTS